MQFSSNVGDVVKSCTLLYWVIFYYNLLNSIEISLAWYNVKSVLNLDVDLN